MARKPAVSIETMIDEVFNPEIDDELIEELAEAQTLIRNFVSETVVNDELWEQLAEKNNIEERKQFLELIAITFIENDSNMFQIDLITSEQEKK
ncbi:MAG: hypothetical protein ACO295_03305 [Sediminibacterium sp.]